MRTSTRRDTTKLPDKLPEEIGTAQGVVQRAKELPDGMAAGQKDQ